MNHERRMREIVERIASGGPSWSDLTEDDLIRHTKDVPQFERVVFPMPRGVFDLLCENDKTFDGDAALAAGKKHGVDAEIGPHLVVFTKPIPQAGVVWKGKQ